MLCTIIFILGGCANIKPPALSPDITTTYQVTFVDNSGCIGSQSVKVNVVNRVTLFAGNDTTLCRTDQFTLRPSSDGLKYEWTPAAQLSCNNCAVPTGLATGFQTYNIKVTSDSGCVATDKVSVFIECKDASLLLPTAFTPNNDGLNDRLSAKVVGYIDLTYFKIYNKWGQLVFETKQLNTGWDGNYKGLPQNTGSFIWLAQGRDINGNVLNDKGSFTLIR